MSRQFSIGDVWYARFPLEENPNQYIERPAIIADVNLPDVAIIKITKHDPRDYDPFDTIIVHFNHAKLKLKSTARVSKLVVVNEKQILNRKGSLHPDDYNRVFSSLSAFLNE